ncbi:class II myosin [Cryptotrichosporon argae]
MKRIFSPQRRTLHRTLDTLPAFADVDVARRVWIPDPVEGFLPGWIKSQEDDGPEAVVAAVVATTGEVRNVPAYTLSPMNPPQFDGVEDIAELTHLNEASVVNDLRLRYGSGSIYTYSGLFLISLNPYRPLPIYTPKIVSQYRTKRREENPPHIFAIAERAWQQIGEERESQSILITGESGAGKTENTKKVIQYLAAIASSFDPSNAAAPMSGLPRSSSFKGKESDDIASGSDSGLGLLEQQILQANPILEAFGNAQTMRNNNSSRFGKFIRIFFSPAGAIAGANIDWYLLEKSRVTARAEGERSFHVFYQLLKGWKESKLDSLLLEGGPEKYDFLAKTRKQIDGVDDLSEWRLLKEALNIVGFSKDEQYELFRVVAVILHIGNLALTGNDQAFLPPSSQPVAERVCHLLGVSVKDFSKAFLTPKVRAGREWVTQARTRKQADDELGALCKSMYEKVFSSMVDRINTAIDRPAAKSLSIGVLDIAGFEIFVENSYEQLLINFTNERLQQFFNFHMFTLEQEEYTREGIDWDYVNFGLDLQPTIELIESTQPVGILATLDEECIMPKATDLTFTEKVQQLWEAPRGSSPKHPGSAKFKATRFGQGFVIKHYAGDVEYRTEGWLNKNKDPLNDAVARLLATSDVSAVKAMFVEFNDDAETSAPGKRVKRGAFRTVGQRHKEQLGQLMSQLAATQPHFVRCIVPNSDKQPGRVDVPLVLDQLRCNGVLEGIRIARLGYPNRHSFAEFRQRYEVLTPGVIPRGYIDGRSAAQLIAEALELDKDFYKIGATKIFFKAGILAELEERRDNLLTDLFRRFQSAARMHICRRRINKLANRTHALRTIQRNARVYIALRDWPWWSLYVKVRPLLAATRTDDQLVRQQAELQMAKERAERDEAEKKRLQDLRASLVADKDKVEKALSAERNLALEKDRMLERSKASEAELGDKIAQLEDALAALADDKQHTAAAADEAQATIVKLKRELERHAQQAAMLEKEGEAWRKRETELLRESKERSAVHAKLEDERKELGKVVDELRRAATKHEDALKRVKERSDLSVAELEKRLQLERTKADSGNSQVAALNDDLRQAVAQYEEAQQTIKKHETAVAAKTRELADLETRRATAARAHEASEKAKSELSVKLDALRTELESVQRERARDVEARQTLERELDDLRKVMAAKASEDIQRREADRSRETEMANLREQVDVARAELDRDREAARQAASKLRVDIERLKQDHQAARAELSATKAALKDREAALAAAQVKVADAEKDIRRLDAELGSVRAKVAAAEGEAQQLAMARDDLTRQLAAESEKYMDLEDAVLSIEEQKNDLAARLGSTSQSLADESARRQQLEHAVHDAQSQVAEYRNVATAAERELAKAASEIKVRDDEIALLRSRENKTIVEHVHVLEQAKKMTDRQLVEQVGENKRLNTVMRSLETHRNRLQNDYDDLARQFEIYKKTKAKEARAARASLGPEDKETSALLEEERRARRAAEARVASLEKDLQDQRRQQSTAAISASPSSSRIMKAHDELSRLSAAHDAAVAENARLHVELADARGAAPATGRGTGPSVPSTPTHGTHAAARADLLRGLQQSHDALGRDMSDQLRKLEAAAPLTPSRRHNSAFVPGLPANGGGGVGGGVAALASPGSAENQKRVRQLESDVATLRLQLEVERDEKDFLSKRLRENEGGDGSPFPYEQAVYSHFRLKAKSLRSQLDHWLAMEDLNKAPGAGAKMTASHSAPFAEDVQKLKYLLSQLDPETSPLRAT